MKLSIVKRQEAAVNQGEKDFGDTTHRLSIAPMKQLLPIGSISRTVTWLLAINVQTLATSCHQDQSLLG